MMTASSRLVVGDVDEPGDAGVHEGGVADPGDGLRRVAAVRLVEAVQPETDAPMQIVVSMALSGALAPSV